MNYRASAWFLAFFLPTAASGAEPWTLPPCGTGATTTHRLELLRQIPTRGRAVAALSSPQVQLHDGMFIMRGERRRGMRRVRSSGEITAGPWPAISCSHTAGTSSADEPTLPHQIGLVQQHREILEKTFREATGYRGSVLTSYSPPPRSRSIRR